MYVCVTNDLANCLKGLLSSLLPHGLVKVNKYFGRGYPIRNIVLEKYPPNFLFFLLKNYPLPSEAAIILIYKVVSSK